MSKEARLGLVIAAVVGLVLGIAFYLLLGLAGDTLGGVVSGVPGVTEKTPDDVVQAFRDEGLKVGTSWDVEEDPEWGTGNLPKTMDSGTRFEIPGYKSFNRVARGDVFHFATPEDQKVMSSYLETVGKSSGLFYTHVYETDGFLLKIDGNVPKTTAEEFNEVFQSVA